MNKRYEEERRTMNDERREATELQEQGPQEQAGRLIVASEVEVEPVPELEPKIYVASLIDYNNGVLQGEWLNAELEPEQLLAKTKAMLAKSPTTRRYGEPAEEWAIHDYQDFASIKLSEYEDFTTVSALARGLIDHGPAYGAWVEYNGKQSEQLETFEDCYLGEFDSVRDYSEQILDDLGYTAEIEKLIPTNLRPYIKLDASAFGRDLILSGDVWAQETPDGKVWLFCRE